MVVQSNKNGDREKKRKEEKNTAATTNHLKNISGTLHLDDVMLVRKCCDT